MKTFIITIARGLGSGGSHIGHALAEELAIKYYDEEILQMAADLSGINEKYFWDANTRITKGQVAINNSTGVYNKNVTYKEGDKEYLSNENIFNIQAQVLKNLVFDNKQSCVVIGKAANYVLRGLKNVVKINIQAPQDKCVKNLTRRLGLGTNEAIALIEKTDKYRSDYYKYYTGGSWISPKEYDLCINTGSINEAYATKMIIDLLRQRELI
ncbi:MAG: cytidylate kinase-like family protein [Lachnospiraceae bacterium]|nr:cytidylate kinase-like family protein [Lachnospiraceae bacterium]